jgi:NAD(P)-dependent dehydrogenase (short-subunit alcohol dehydrogenase family)
MKLLGRVAIVTGGTSGIGRAVAIFFAQEGAKVVVTGRNSARLAEVEKMIKKDKGECIGVLAELPKLSEIDKLVGKTIQTFGKLDILFNGAGIIGPSIFVETTEELFDQVIDTDLKGVYFVTQRAAKEMIKQGRGKIINMSSVGGGVIGAPNISAYCAAKAGIAALTKCLALELGPHHINVNAITPGNVITPMNEAWFANPDYMKYWVDQTPLGRIGTVQDIANMALFLASDESDYATGQQFIIDGGVSCGSMGKIG